MVYLKALTFILLTGFLETGHQREQDALLSSHLSKLLTCPHLQDTRDTHAAAMPLLSAQRCPLPQDVIISEGEKGMQPGLPIFLAHFFPAMSQLSKNAS